MSDGGSYAVHPGQRAVHRAQTYTAPDLLNFNKQSSSEVSKMHSKVILLEIKQKAPYQGISPNCCSVMQPRLDGRAA